MTGPVMIGKLLRAVAAAVVLAAAVLVGWRVLAPAEVLEPAAGADPVAATPAPGVTGKTSLAPLIVDGRLRVYAGARVVKADAPVEAKTMETARWSYRRWPQRLTGVVAADATVVTRWSDGDVVALDGRTGDVAWRAAGPGAEPFTGRTGSAAVWAAPGLHSAGTEILITDGRRLTARAVADGAQRWVVTLPAGCGNGFVTAGGRYVCDTGAWDVRTGTVVEGWPAGPSTAIGCDVSRSGCAGLRDGSGRGWLTGGPQPRRDPLLDAPGATAAGDLVLATSGGAVVAFRAGREVWRWAGAAQVLGVRSGRAVAPSWTRPASAGSVCVLLAADLRLVELDAATGVQRAAFPLYVPRERVEAWKLGRWQLTEGFLALERLRVDGVHFYTTDPVIIAAL